MIRRRAFVRGSDRAPRGFLTGWVLSLLLAAGVQAHRVDEYLQAALVRIEPDHVLLTLNLQPGTDVADLILSQLDTNGDGVISSAEESEYLRRLAADLSLHLDGKPLVMTQGNHVFAEIAELRTGSGQLHLEYYARLPEPAAGPHTLALTNRHLPQRSVYLANAVMPHARTIAITRQLRNDTQSDVRFEFSFQPPITAAPARGTPPSPAFPFRRYAGMALGIVLLTGAIGIWRRRHQ